GDVQGIVDRLLPSGCSRERAEDSPDERANIPSGRSGDTAKGGPGLCSNIRRSGQAGFWISRETWRCGADTAEPRFGISGKTHVGILQAAGDFWRAEGQLSAWRGRGAARLWCRLSCELVNDIANFFTETCRPERAEERRG